MSWNEDCIHALSQAGMFEDSGHMTRFKEFLDCFSDKPFFNKGVCKCMYMSAWDEEHFLILLETLSHMLLGRDTDTEDMRIRGVSYADEQPNDETYIYRLSVSYLDGTEFCMDENVQLSPRTAYVIRRAREAAAIIDGVKAD